MRRKRLNFDLYSYQSELMISTTVATELTKICRRARATIAEKEAIAQDTEEALRKKELEAEERRKQSHDLVAQTIRRELAESKHPSTDVIPKLTYTNSRLQKRRRKKSQMLMIRTDWILVVNLRHGGYGNLGGLRRRRRMSWHVRKRGKRLNADERCLKNKE